ncbi:hypothetical protein B7494_g7687 [Chlorociboria aeruginascens]|nr:hypothetical protein B7494_g7687 [Chlorociboria aeruginascens]
MHASWIFPTLLSALLLPLTNAQAAQGGGVVAGVSAAATQYPTLMEGNSLYTVDGTTTASFGPYTQTFAATALGSWPLGATPLVGSIGLGAIQGVVGNVKTRRDGVDRALETAAAAVKGRGISG